MVVYNKIPGIRVTHPIIVKAPGLLPMMYKVRELAQEIGIAERTLRDWLKKGAPHQRDSNKRIWIIGTEFAAWVKAQRGKKKKRKLGDNEAYCFRCKENVKLVDPEVRPIKGKLVHIKGKCGRCGCTINRGGRVASSGSLLELSPSVID